MTRSSIALITCSLACNRRSAVTSQIETASEHVCDEEAESLRPLIEIGACSAFVAVLRNHADIVTGRNKPFVPTTMRIR